MIDAFSLDPVHLPLGAAEIETDRPQGLHGVFEDALPDDWGRALLFAKYHIPRAEQTVPNLLKFLGTSGLGALFFYSGKEKACADPSVFRWQDVFEEYDVPKKDIQRLEPSISRGLSRLRP